MRGFSIFILCGLFVALAIAANFRLYLKDGSYQVVREYTVEGDRVKYYSTERSDWEEIPLELVDLKKTQGEIKQRDQSARENAKALDEEEKAEREAAREVSKVPMQTGAYLIVGEDVKPIKIAEPKVVNKNGRKVLRYLSPIPMITDKATVELDGPHSATTVTDPRPEFYIRLSDEERFGIVKLSLHKGNRVVENVTIIPAAKETMEEPVQLIDTFRKQVSDMLYRIWPEKPLEPGEYAVMEYTEGKLNMQVWDFAYGGAPAGK